MVRVARYFTDLSVSLPPIQVDQQPRVIVSKHRVLDVVRQRTLFREVNERICEINEVFGFDGEHERVEVLCECGGADCVERVEVTLSQYSEIRRRGRNFVVMAGHERAGLDRLVTACPSYRVVETLAATGADAVRPSANGRSVRR